MNLVFQALVILAFVVPGLIFRTRYNRGEWNYPLGRLGPISEQIPKALVHAAWLNAFWAFIVFWGHALCPKLIPGINLKAVVYWLANSFGKDQLFFEDAVKALSSFPLHIFLYFVGLYFFSELLGWLFHRLVRYFHLDRKNWLKSFRFDNDWYYILTGEVLDFPDESYKNRAGMHRPEINADERKATAVAALVDVKDKTYLYLGVLVDFFFDASGNLDRLLLVGAKRRSMDRDKNKLEPGEDVVKTTGEETIVERTTTTVLEKSPEGSLAEEETVVERTTRTPLQKMFGGKPEDQEAIGHPGNAITSPLPADTTDHPYKSSFLDTKRFYPISGHFFVLRMSEVRSLNIDYLTADELNEYRKLQLELVAKYEADHPRVPTMGDLPGSTG